VRTRNLTRLATLACLFLLAGCAGYSPRKGDGMITVQNQRTGEHATLQYRYPNGELDLNAWQQASYLMRDVRTADGMMIDPLLLDFMSELRASLGLAPQAVVVVTSGFRAPQTNAALRRQSGQVAENSYHMRGQAADIKIPGRDPRDVASMAMKLRRGGVAYYPRSGHVHIDTGPVRTWKAS